MRPIHALAAAATLVLPAAALAETAVETVRRECREQNTGPRGLNQDGQEACLARRLPPAEAEDAATLERAKASQPEPAKPDQLTAQLDAAIAEEQKADDARRQKCGVDYMRVRVGMKFARVAECAGPLDLRYEDRGARVYQGAGGLVWVQRGSVTRVLFR